MANEYEILTENEVANSWVDSAPGRKVTTGYQSQNTNIEARWSGMDLSSVRAQGSNVVIEISGPIDVNGLPFVGTQEIVLIPPSQGNYYIEIINGSSLTQKSVQLTTNAPTWDSTKNGFYRSGNKYLNCLISYIKGDINLYNIEPASASLGSFESVNFPYGFVRGFDLYDRFWYINRQAEIEAQGDIAYTVNYNADKTYSMDYSPGDSDSRVYIQDGFTDTVLDTLSVPVEASGIVYIPNRNEILVCFDSLTDSSIRRYDADSGDFKGSFTTDLENVDLTYDEQDDIIYIASDATNRTARVRGSDFTILGYFGIGLNSNSGLAFDFIKRRLLYSDQSSSELRAVNITSGAQSVVSQFISPLGEMLKKNGNLIEKDSITGRRVFGF